MPDPGDATDVLRVISLYEADDSDFANAIIDAETGLDLSTVDEVHDHLWRSDRVEGIMTAGDRNPSLVGFLRVLPDRDRLWGDEGRYRGSIEGELMDDE